MSDKRFKRNLSMDAVLAMLFDGKEAEVVDSSDTDEDVDSEEETRFMEDIDPVYDQGEDTPGPSTPTPAQASSGGVKATPTSQGEAETPDSSGPTATQTSTGEEKADAASAAGSSQTPVSRPGRSLRGRKRALAATAQSQGDETAGSSQTQTPVSRAGRPLRGLKTLLAATAESEDDDEVFLPPSSPPSSRSPSPPPPPSKKPQKGKRTRSGSAAKQTTPVRGSGECWRGRDDPDVEPPRLKFKPAHPLGPRIDTTVSWSPLSLFKLFFSASTVHTLINNTNANAAQRKAAGLKYKWWPLTVEHFYTFLAVIMFSVLIHVHGRDDFWRKEWPYNFSFPRTSMPRDRFESIFWSLHLCDITEEKENQKRKGTPQYDRLFKIKPLYTQIVDACKSLFQPAREVSIDERMVASKARIGFRQYMKDKPTKFGYKLFVLADSAVGYTWNFFVYEGKRADATKKEGLNFSSVMDLMDFRLLGKGYHVYCDNFYTSPALFQELARHSTAACGTIRQTRIGFPKTTDNDLPKNAPRGDMRWLRKDNLLFVKWKDTKDVAVCSSFHKAFSGVTTSRRVKQGGAWQRQAIPVPDAIKDDNRYMGGVDLSDALIQYYSVKSKTMRWYKTFFLHFVDIAIVNAYVMYASVARGQSQTPITQTRFREVLMKELVEQAKAMGASASSRPTLSTTCLPEYFGTDATVGRRGCVLCKTKGLKVKTPLYCSKCDVALCLTSTRNCFRDYHLGI